MKRYVEQEIKQAVQSWDERKTDLGFDNEMAWGMVLNRTPKKRFSISVFKVAAVLLLFFVAAGWAHSLFVIQRLKQDKIAVVGQVKFLEEEIVSVRKYKQSNNLVGSVQVDTVYKTITKQIESVQLQQQCNHIELQNSGLHQDIDHLKQQLNTLKSQYNVLGDSLLVLTTSLKNYEEQSYDMAVVNTQPVLKINEEVLESLSNERSELDVAKPIADNRKLKIVFFNKTESFLSKAPEQRRIKF